MMYNWDSLFAQEKVSRKNQDTDLITAQQNNNETIHIGIAQINLRAYDFDMLRIFYTQALGVQPRDTCFSEDKTLRACRFDLPGIDLLLSELPLKAEVKDNHVRGPHELVFRVGSVDNVEAAYEHLKSVPGCDPVQFPRYTHDNRYETIVKDPEGNFLIFRD